MKKSKSFGLILLIINLLIILYFYFFAPRGYLEGAPGWILAIIGAPTTFLVIPIFKSIPQFFSNILSQYIMISLFFQLQYQLVIYFLFKIKFKTKFLKTLILALFICIVYFSMRKMYVVVLKP
jgi:hypothetical protein